MKNEGWERLYGGLMPSLVGTAASQVGSLVRLFASFFLRLWRLIWFGILIGCVTVRVSTTTSTKYSGTGPRLRPLSDPGEGLAMDLSGCSNLSLSLPCLGNWNVAEHLMWPREYCNLCSYQPYVLLMLNLSRPFAAASMYCSQTQFGWLLPECK